MGCLSVEVSLANSAEIAQMVRTTVNDAPEMIEATAALTHCRPCAFDQCSVASTQHAEAGCRHLVAGAAETWLQSKNAGDFRHGVNTQAPECMTAWHQQRNICEGCVG